MWSGRYAVSNLNGGGHNMIARCYLRDGRVVCIKGWESEDEFWERVRKYDFLGVSNGGIRVESIEQVVFMEENKYNKGLWDTIKDWFGG